MSIQPQNVGLSTSLVGVMDVNTSYYDSRIGSPSKQYENPLSIYRTVLLTLVSAVLFVTAISIYDIIRQRIVTYYARRAIEDPDACNDPQLIRRTLIVNRESFASTVTFSLVCIIIALIIIPILIYYIHKSFTS